MNQIKITFVVPYFFLFLFFSVGMIFQALTFWLRFTNFKQNHDFSLVNNVFEMG